MNFNNERQVFQSITKKIMAIPNLQTNSWKKWKKKIKICHAILRSIWSIWCPMNYYWPIDYWPFLLNLNVVTTNHLVGIISSTLNQIFLALDSNDDVPETTFVDFHISDHLVSFDSETDYIGLMIADVKFQNKWYHDGRKHKFMSFNKPNQMHRQKRYARRTQNTWRKWTKRKNQLKQFT